MVVPPTRTVDGFHEGGWRHVALVWTGKEIRFYVNGELDNSQPTPSGTLIVESRTLIGNGVGWNRIMHNFNGLISDVRVFTRALNEAEIQRLYHLHD